MSSNESSDSDISVDEKPKRKPIQRQGNQCTEQNEATPASKSKSVRRTRLPNGAIQKCFLTDDEAPADADFNIDEAEQQHDKSSFYGDSDIDDDFKGYRKRRATRKRNFKKKLKTAAVPQVFKPCLEYSESAAAAAAYDDGNAADIEVDIDDVEQQQQQQNQQPEILLKPKAGRKRVNNRGRKKKSDADPAVPLVPIEESSSTSLLVASSVDPSHPSNMTQQQRRENIVDYFNAYKAGNPGKKIDECRYRTVRDLTRQGYNSKTVSGIIKRILNNTMSIVPKRRSHNKRPLHVIADVRDKFHEYVQMVAGGDLSKVVLAKFAESIGSKYSNVAPILRDDELFKRVRQARADEEATFEARRSFIVSKFIEFSGTLNERRNACKRYFWKTPLYEQKMIIRTCNRFLKYGTIRTYEKNKATVWAGDENSHKGDELSPAEAEFLQALNVEHSRLACKLNLGSVTKRPQVLVPSSTNENGDILIPNGEAASSTEGRVDIVAALTTRNEELERELQDAKNLIAQLYEQQRQQRLYENEPVNANYT